MSNYDQNAEIANGKKIVPQRVFIALPAGAAMQRAAAFFHRRNRALPVRWTLPENLHITLVPPWLCDDCCVVSRYLGMACREVQPFEISFSMVSQGPSSGNGRLIWVTGRAPSVLEQFRQRLLDLPCIVGQQEEQGRFLMHMTLARFRKGSVVKFSEEPAVQFREICRSAVLYASFRHPSGARYTELCRASFGQDCL